jgi:hypothetical protein
VIELVVSKFPFIDNSIPVNAKTIIYVTYFLAGLGFFFGLLIFLATLGAEPTNNPEADALPNFDYFFHVLGFVFMIVGFVSLVGNFLFGMRYRVGWFILAGIYCLGTVLTGYIMYRAILVMTKYNLFTVPYHIIFLLIIGLVGIYNLFHKNTISSFFRPSFAQ